MIPTYEIDPRLDPHDRTHIPCREHRPVLLLELGEHHNRHLPLAQERPLQTREGLRITHQDRRRPLSAQRRRKGGASSLTHREATSSQTTGRYRDLTHSPPHPLQADAARA